MNDSDLLNKEPAKIRGMFAGIAPTYDFLNHLLSFNRDKAWRKVTARWVNLQPEETALDVCAGTLDLSLALRRQGKGRVHALDFCHPMLVIGQEKVHKKSEQDNISVSEGDALHLPFADAQFEALTVAFGVRNLVDLDQGFLEFHRVLKPGGRLAILEFSQPENPVFAFFYRFYNRFILPLIGRMFSKDATSYTYLPESVKAFPHQKALVNRIEGAGFSRVNYRNMTFGTVALHTGHKE